MTLAITAKRSVGGTTLNGEAVGQQPLPLSDGDRLTFGEVEARFVGS
ncbi:MAG: FHA domain-containing protein, partial [Planctomycetaceae bacterium]